MIGGENSLRGEKGDGCENLVKMYVAEQSSESDPTP